MAAGAVTYRLTDAHINRTGANVTVNGNATKYVEDDDGVLQSFGNWGGTVTYTVAVFAAKTGAQLNADLIAEIKAKNAAVASKTIT